jgi:hypothetical protein
MSDLISGLARPEPADPRHVAFLALVPTIRRVAAFRFRLVPCPDRRADLEAETVALGWAWFSRLTARDKDPAAFPVTFATLAARAVAAGRRVAGGESVRDVLARPCRLRHGYAVRSLAGKAPGDAFADALVENTKTAVPVQVQFRHDFRAWLAALKPRDRRVAVRLALGHGTGEVAGRFGLTAARVSQLRGELRRNFMSFLTTPNNH